MKMTETLQIAKSQVNGSYVSIFAVVRGQDNVDIALVLNRFIT